MANILDVHSEHQRHHWKVHGRLPGTISKNVVDFQQNVVEILQPIPEVNFGSEVAK